MKDRANFSFQVFLALLLLGTPVFAQNAVPSSTDYFNDGSAAFIRETPEKALAIVTEGLVKYPDNEQLIRLKKLIEQQDDKNKQDQQQQQNQQDQQDQQKQDQQDQGDQNQPPPEQPEQKPDEQPEDKKDQKDDEKPDQPSDEKDQQKPPEEAEDMTEEEAEMVLDSLRQLEEAQREQMTQEIIKRKMRNMPPVEKDW